MSAGRLEHVNVTVSDPRAMAALLCDLFGWAVRWEGAAMGGAGHTVHVGGADSYVAVYAGPGPQTVPKRDASYVTCGALNHLGVVVEDLDAVERAVRARGFAPHSHADYAPGRRFYFEAPDGVEIEVVSYG